MPPPRRSAVVFAALGPNPAPLTELIWKLAKDGRFDHFEPHLVVERRAKHFLDLEVLAPGAALELLRGVLGAETVADPVVSEARDSSGALIEDDVEPEARASYVQAVWTAARAAVEAAGDRPVVFGLIGGRRRTMTALKTAVFQLLARPQDLLLDVRVSDPRVEGGTGFFFPEQPVPYVLAKHHDEVVATNEVEVVLVPLDLPKLRPFVPPGALGSLAEATAATDAALAAAAPPHLKVDLHEPAAYADGERIPLPRGELIWYAFLCHRRAEGDVEVWTRDLPLLRAFLDRLAPLKWWADLPEGSVYREARTPDYCPDDVDRLSTWRSHATSKVRAFAAERRPSFVQLVPERDRRKHEDSMLTFQRIPLDPRFIEIVGI